MSFASETQYGPEGQNPCNLIILLGESSAKAAMGEVVSGQQKAPAFAKPRPQRENHVSPESYHYNHSGQEPPVIDNFNESTPFAGVRTRLRSLASDKIPKQRAQSKLFDHAPRIPSPNGGDGQGKLNSYPSVSIPRGEYLGGRAGIV
jgi:hypothetical protein